MLAYINFKGKLVMKEKLLTVQEVLEISSRQESHFFDRKAKEIDGKKIQKIAVAFANADGGDFVIGIKDDKDEPVVAKRWEGELIKEDLNKIFQNLLEIKPSVPYQATFLEHPIQKTFALLITVEKSEKVHQTSDNSILCKSFIAITPFKRSSKNSRTFVCQRRNFL